MKNEKINFQPLSQETLINALPYIKGSNLINSDLSAGYLFMWHKGLDTRICIYKDTLIIREQIGEQPAFSYPIGKNVDLAIDALKEYALKNDMALRFFGVGDETLEKIQNDNRLLPFSSAYERRWSDYIYSFEETLYFKGKKFSGQRNHINKFKKLYGEPNARFLDDKDIESIKALLKEYSKEHKDGGFLEKIEIKRTKELLNIYPLLDMKGAGLFLDNKLIAFSLGEVIGETLIIHVEKALRRYEGVYPTMYSAFVKLINEETNGAVKYINREDDSGDLGLRTSKMQYQPIKLSHKRLVHVGTPAVNHDKNVVLKADNIVLTSLRETDKQAYMDLNMDLENNKFWGYDYREDYSIFGEITIDTFYDSVTYDMDAGDSINFAIRKEEKGEMMGEVILWNFTLGKTAEIGCRLLPKYQGNGYGKTAFGIATDYAEKVLKVKLFTKCFAVNKPSVKMITANGFNEIKRDGKYIFFNRE